MRAKQVNVLTMRPGVQGSGCREVEAPENDDQRQEGQESLECGSEVYKKGMTLRFVVEEHKS